MRIYFLTLFTLTFFNHSVLSQSLSQYESGSYVVAGAPFTHVPGKLKTKNNNLLLVKTPDGRKLQFFPEQIISFRAGGRKFIVVDRFKILTENAPRGFAEVLDSGQVLLMRYKFTSDVPVMISSGVNTNGIPVKSPYTTGSPSGDYYLIRRANSSGPPTVLIDDWFYGARKIFNRTLAPFVPSQRPDLLEVVKQSAVSPRTITDFIRAINTGQSFK